MASHPRFDAWPSALLDMMAGHRVTAVIYVAACLGIPDELVAGPRTSADLARRTGAHEPSLRRLLRALVTLDVCTESNQHAFELTALGRYLPGNARQSLKPWVLLEGGFLRHSWGSLIDSIRTGKTEPELAGWDVEKGFEHLAELGNAPPFNEAMVALTRFVAPAVARAYDFTGIGKLIDVGGVDLEERDPRLGRRAERQDPRELPTRTRAARQAAARRADHARRVRAECGASGQRPERPQHAPWSGRVGADGARVPGAADEERLHDDAGGCRGTHEGHRGRWPDKPGFVSVGIESCDESVGRW